MKTLPSHGPKRVAPLLTRRRLVALAGSSIAAAAGVGLYTRRVEPHWLEIVRRRLPIRDLPAGLVGRTLVQLSDIHVGHRVDDTYLVKTFEQVADLNPDVVVLTGDLTSYHPDVLPQVQRVYRHFPKGRLATLAIPGNHDYGPNWSHPEIADAVVNAVIPLGITVLRNEVRDVAGLQIVGLDDLWGNRFRPGRALAGLDPSRPALVLSHNPDTVDLPVWGTYEGWILSGHTHGGQCKPPLLPPRSCRSATGATRRESSS